MHNDRWCQGLLLVLPHRLSLALVVIIGTLIACNDGETVDLGDPSNQDREQSGGDSGSPRQSEAPIVGGTPAMPDTPVTSPSAGGTTGPIQGPQPGATQSEIRPNDAPPANINPNKDLFERDIMPILFRGCAGALCHSVEKVQNNFEFEFEGTSGNLSPEQLENNFNEFKSETWINYAAPSESGLFFHDESFPRGYVIPETATWNTIVNWIEDAVRGAPPVEDQSQRDEQLGGEIGGGGTSSSASANLTDGMDIGGWESSQAEPQNAVPCDGLPTANGFGGPTWREKFESDGINEILVGSEANPGAASCSGGVCHTVQGNGLWLLGPDDPCSPAWNFLVVQSYINPLDIDRSQLLEQPLGEVNQDPTMPEHGGRVVFLGRDDERFIRLKRWLQFGQEQTR